MSSWTNSGPKQKASGDVIGGLALLSSRHCSSFRLAQQKIEIPYQMKRLREIHKLLDLVFDKISIMYFL